MRRLLPALLAATLALTIAATGVASASPRVPATTGDEPLSAQVVRTEFGIPHITASSYTDLGYGYGHELAIDNICILADTYATVDARRSFYFGPTGSYVFQGNGQRVNNLNSDFFFQQIVDAGTVEALVAQPAPQGPLPQVRQLVTGYVRGYNQFLSEVGRGERTVTDPACAGKAWVNPITETQVYRRFYQLALLASSGVAIDGIAEAAPPTPSAPVPTTTSPDVAARQLQEEFKTLAIGSNAVAVGRAGTTSGRGVLLGNPHFPWNGAERFWQAHLTIPGTLDVTGGSLLGVPLILIGHNATMAWSHTVSTAFRFTPYELTLVPGSPTTYLYEGTPTAMTKRTVSVDVGGGKTSSRTLYSTRYGTMLTSILGLPLFPWTPTKGYAIRDANAANFRYVNHFLETNLATSARAELKVLKRNQGVPWVNTIAVDDAGDALYADISVTPHVTDAQARTCNTALGAATFAALRLPVLDGSRAACEWGSDPDSLQPGTFGPSKMPSLIRRDYVTNSNDSYWLSNPAKPLTGFATIIGDEGTARTLRTRLGLLMTKKIADAKGFNRQVMQDMVFNDRQYAAELTRDAVVSMCSSFPGGMAPSSSGPVPVGQGCTVLAGWSGRDDLDAPGAVLFRRFWTRATATETASIWAVPFTAADPVTTPNTLVTSNPKVQLAFGDAIKDLAGAGIPLAGTLREFQYVTRNGARIPIHGGPGTLGLFNAINTSWDPTKGYPTVNHGSSFVQSVAFDGTGCPDAATILTYSQSADPTSPWYDDQTRLFSSKTWVKDRFCKADIAASPVRLVSALSTQTLPAPVVPEAPYAVLLPLVAILGAGFWVYRRRQS